MYNTHQKQTYMFNKQQSQVYLQHAQRKRCFFPHKSLKKKLNIWDRNRVQSPEFESLFIVSVILEPAKGSKTPSLIILPAEVRELESQAKNTDVSIWYIWWTRPRVVSKHHSWSSR
jgi:hypothetical protein